ncbi:hypothetical protein LZ31DRAFT_293740 [Colletotrichum somersetense]|nr:hypothetical protein LZ31DRAFT_293740 [Colletotrichum somersetense]
MYMPYAQEHAAFKFKRVEPSPVQFSSVQGREPEQLMCEGRELSRPGSSRCCQLLDMQGAGLRCCMPFAWLAAVVMVAVARGVRWARERRSGRRECVASPQGPRQYVPHGRRWPWPNSDDAGARDNARRERAQGMRGRPSGGWRKEMRDTRGQRRARQ